MDTKNLHNDNDDDDDVNNDDYNHVIPPIPTTTWNLLPEAMIRHIIYNYFDVQDLVEIKLVSRQWQRLATTAIDSKGIGTTRKAFETNEELREVVLRYCPIPDCGFDMSDIDSVKQQYCRRDIAEDIASTYGWPIGKWDVSQIENFSCVFRGYKWNEETGNYEHQGTMIFNEDISEWNVSNATIMDHMFCNADKFNQNLSSWDVSKVTIMRAMFYSAVDFNQDISSWDVSNVTNMEGMFRCAIRFNYNLSSWNVSNVTNMHDMFYNTNEVDPNGFDHDLSSWNVANVRNMGGMFNRAEPRMPNQDVSTWGDGWHFTNMDEDDVHVDRRIEDNTDEDGILLLDTDEDDTDED